MKISIIITAFQSQDFIEVCLNSIKEQTWLQNKNNEIEVLIGIDGCPDTLNKLNEIRCNYNFLKLFYSEINVGTYVMRNSLVQKASNDNILFFDSDDIMHLNMLDIISPSFNTKQITRYCFYCTLRDNNTYIVKNNYHKNAFYAMGSFGISKELFLETGGFLAWSCAADYEFITRCEKNNIPTNYINKLIFYHLRHSNSLTQDRRTGMLSKKREKYHQYIHNNINWSIPINTCTTNIINI